MSGSFKPAARKATPIRCLFLGRSKDGKTYSAIAVAHHLAAAMKVPPERIFVIDVEVVGEGDAAMGRTEQLVDEACGCVRCNGRGLRFSGHNVALLAHPSGKDYIRVMNEAAAAGAAILVVDQITAEWEACLAVVDAMQGKVRDKWAEVTPMHDEFLAAIMRWPGHVLATCRAKDKTSSGEDGKTIVGLAPIQRDGIEFEFDVAVWMSRGELGECASRSPTLNRTKWHRPGADLADALLAWSRSGENAAAARQAALDECLKLVAALPEAERKKCTDWLSKNGGDPTAPVRLLARLKGDAPTKATPRPATDGPTTPTTPPAATAMPPATGDPTKEAGPAGPTSTKPSEPSTSPSTPSNASPACDAPESTADAGASSKATPDPTPARASGNAAATLRPKKKAATT